MNSKGQSSLEYLLVIGGGVAIAAIVIFLILNASAKVSTGDEITRLSKNSQHCEVRCHDSACRNEFQSVKDCSLACKDRGKSDVYVNVEDCAWNCFKDPVDWYDKKTNTLC